MSLVILGSPTSPWRAAEFIAVDDRVRGGSSQSHLEPSNDGLEARFYGHLDTSTLGGAGFASQAWQHPPALFESTYSGLRLTVRLPTGLEASPPTSYVLTIKTDTPPRRPDGRRESVVTYEYAFNIGGDGGEEWEDSISEAGNEKEGRRRTYEAGWKEFRPTYRGKPCEDAPRFHPGQMTELSFMCRSNFDKQSGDFDITLETLEALYWPRKTWYSMAWYWCCAAWRTLSRSYVRCLGR